MHATLGRISDGLDKRTQLSEGNIHIHHPNIVTLGHPLLYLYLAGLLLQTNQGKQKEDIWHTLLV